MSRLLSKDAEGDLTTRFGARQLHILGVVYGNTAAKFWSGLIDEIIQDFPSCDTIVLSAPESLPLSRDLLFPEDSLQREFDNLMECNLEEVMREVMEELEMFGPPSGVGISLFSGDKELKSQELPLECIDAGVFSYLLVWLLEWARIPEGDWNNEFLAGDIAAADYYRKLNYGMAVEFRNEHLSEGLFRRSVTLRFDRKPLERRAG